MPHDEHFLTRIDRLSGPLAEFALSLYRDHEFVRFLLQRLALDDNSGRVVVALTSEPDGPHVVLARDGAFVTCLGAGMSTGPHLVVARSRVDALLRKHEDLRTRGELAKRYANSDRAFVNLIGRIGTSGNGLSREEFLAIASVQPILAIDFLREQLRIQSSWREAFEQVSKAADLRGARRTEKSLRMIWQASWALAHLSVLTSMDDTGVVEKALTASRNASLEIPSMSLGHARTGCLGVAVRGWWAASRANKLFIPVYRKLLDGPMDGSHLSDATMGLAAIASRHSKTRAEVLRTLRPPAPDDGAQPSRNDAVRDSIAGLLESAFEQGRMCDPVVEQIGASMWLRVQKQRAGGAHVYSTVEEVPRDLAAACLLNADAPFHGAAEDVILAAMSTMWAARQRPEALYLPRAALDAVREPWSLELASRVVPLGRSVRFAAPVPQPVRAVEVPGRNSLCTCGSGRKYKRCCAA